MTKEGTPDRIATAKDPLTNWPLTEMLHQSIAMFTNQWMIFIFVAGVLLGLTEFGFRLGMRLYEAKDEARKGQISGVQGAILGMLGLLLGFTFAMAEGRYDMRRELVLQEANAIGTTYLRASFLPAPHRSAAENLLRNYVEARLTFYAAGTDDAKVAAAEREAAGVQRELWAHTADAGKEAPTALLATFINALNQMIDLDATRLNALRTRVPGAVWLLVLVVAGSGCCVSGYGAGASGKRGGFANAALPLLIAVVITLIADLDSPDRGVIGISQQPLLELKSNLAPAQ